MNIQQCPICENNLSKSVLEISQCAIIPYASSRESTNENKLYQDIKIQECEACGHEWNINYKSNELISLYGNEVAACVPVTTKMVNRFKELSDYIHKFTGKRKRTADIGAGSCSFALNFAEHSEVIDIFEPSIQAKGVKLPNNVNLINDIFTNNENKKYDLIVLKQVLEHIKEARNLLELIANSIKENGYFNLEIPSGDYIHNMRGHYDYHSQQLHYFMEYSIENLLQTLNFEVIDKKHMMEGHDIGYILQKKKRLISRSKYVRNHDLNESESIRQFHKIYVDKNERIVGVYGINAYSQSFLATHREELRGKRIIYFDDNPYAQGKYAMNKGNTSQIFSPSLESVSICDTIYIACYLHDEAIMQKLKKLGYQKSLVSLRPQVD